MNRATWPVLGVRYVIAGDIHASGTRIQAARLSHRIVDRRVARSEKFDGTTADLFDLQDRAVGTSQGRGPAGPPTRIPAGPPAAGGTPERLRKTVRAIDPCTARPRRICGTRRRCWNRPSRRTANMSPPRAARTPACASFLYWSEHPSRTPPSAARSLKASVERDDTDARAISSRPGSRLPRQRPRKRESGTTSSDDQPAPHSRLWSARLP